MSTLDVEIMHHVRSPKLINRSEMRVKLCETFNRRTLPEPLERNISDVWRDRVEKNPKLYNGTKFRIDSVSSEDNGTLIMNLGVTCYKEYLGTNWSPEVKQFQLLGQRDGGNPQLYLSDPLGVGSFVVTSDSHVILLRRSKFCGEAPGLWDVPGGHAEPEELVGKKPFEDITLSSMEPKAVVGEIFDSIIREIRDEVNLPLSTLSEPQLMGIARNTMSAGRPSMEFLIRCSLTSKEVETRYRQGNQAEADESTNIQLLPLDDVVTMETNNVKLWTVLAPSARGCIVLYRMAHNSETS